MTFKHFCLYSSLFIAWPTQLWAAELSGYTGAINTCPVNSYSSINYRPPPVFSDDLIDTTDISAEQVKNMAKSITTFSGNVIIERHQLRLTADTVTHDKNTQELELTGRVHADTRNMALNAESGWFNLQSNESEFLGGTYFMPDTGLTGKSPSFSFTADKKTILKDTQFSTCPPNKLDWHLDTGWLELDQDEATGTAINTVFWVGSVPIFYFPWMQFPLGDERRSGFLIPTAGLSSSNGFEFGAPYYWNIAPNQDALITPTQLRKRGQLLATEYRYLTRSSKGNVNVDYLENDKKYGDKRYLLHYDNISKLSDELTFNLLLNDASDSDYLKDLSSNINISNTTHLERNAKLKYSNGPWSAALMAQSFQTIDETITVESRPYKRLPQLTLTGKDEFIEMDNSSLLGSLSAEWVEFEHESTNKVQGSRLNIYPKLSLPIEGNSWFVKPSAGYVFTQYDTTNSNGEKENLDSRALPILSLDSGLFLERHFTDGKFLQTLEPRLFYLNVPFKEQSDYPLFDTSEQNFSFASLFRENRFTGVDRVGDANQLTMALSSRILNKNNGHELFNISIGRIYYFDEQQVGLRTANTNKANSSDIITEIGGRLNQWRARATVQWNAQTDTSDKRSVQLSYAASDEAVFNIGYRFQRKDDEADNIEQTDISFAWPFAQNYSLLSRWNRSLSDERDIQTLVGIQYESCCWALRLVSQRYLRSNIAEDEDPYNSSIMLQFVLKGFGSISDKEATNALKYAILGYQPDY